jgi:hypothetical protein
MCIEMRMDPSTAESTRPLSKACLLSLLTRQKEAPIAHLSRLLTPQKPRSGNLRSFAAFFTDASVVQQTEPFEHRKDSNMKKVFFAAAMITALSCPAMADDVGVRVGPVSAGVTVGEGHDHNRDRDRDVVVKEREPHDKTTVIKKEDEDGNRSKTVIHRDND